MTRSTQNVSPTASRFARTLGVFSLVAVAVTCMFFSTGCNTMEGVGRDVEAAGESIEDAAN